MMKLWQADENYGQNPVTFEVQITESVKYDLDEFAKKTGLNVNLLVQIALVRLLDPYVLATLTWATGRDLPPFLRPQDHRREEKAA